MRDRTAQKARVAFGNRLDAIARGDDIASPKEIDLLEKWYETFESIEQELDRDLKGLAADYEIIEHMVSVRGLGFILAAKVVAMIDITRAENPSSLWRYAGYGVVDGKAERLRKGEKAHFNKRLKTTCYLVGSSFLKTGSPYRDVYDSAREYYEANRDWEKGHIHNAAMRKMIKLWLSHLWDRWRRLEGLPVTEPYVKTRLGHRHITYPEDFGWPPW
jgi:hypothetical protein